MKQHTSLFISFFFLLVVCCHPAASAQTDKGQSIKTSVMTYPVKQISISINKPFDEVYRFASNPANFPKWIKFIKSIQPQQGNRWSAQTDMGNLTIDFTPQNSYGIIDHVVIADDGTTVTNPLRIIANGKGSEIIFTLFHMPNRTDAQFSQDAKLVEDDLATVKKLLEAQ